MKHKTLQLLLLIPLCVTVLNPSTALSTSTGPIVEDSAIEKWHFSGRDFDQNDTAIDTAKEAHEAAKIAYEIGNPYRVFATMGYANAMTKSGEIDAAIKLLREEIETLKNDEKNHPYAVVLLSEQLVWFVEPSEKMPLFDRILELSTKLFGRDLGFYSTQAGFIGMYLAHQTEHYGKSLQLLGVSLRYKEREFGSDHEYLIPNHMGIAKSYLGFNELELATEHIEEALAIAEAKLLPVDLADLLFYAAGTLANSEEALEVKLYLQRALSLYKANLSTGEAKILLTRQALANREILEKNPGSALLIMQEALIDLHASGEPVKDEITIRRSIVHALEEMGRRDEATEHCLALSHLEPWGADERSRPVLKLPPVYPEEERKKANSGYVVVEYTVDEKGVVRSPQIMESSVDGAFHEAAINASYRFRYAPRLENGKPVSTEGIKNKFTFKLE